MTRDEVDRLTGLPHTAIALYALALRPRAGADGFVRGATWTTLAQALRTRPIPGRAGESPSVGAVRRAFADLEARGLVAIRGGLVELLAFQGGKQETARGPAGGPAAVSPVESTGQRPGPAGGPTGLESGTGSPLAPPSPSPLVHPPSSAPPHPPSLRGARDPLEAPAFELTPPPSQDVPSAEQAQDPDDRAKGRIPATWVPSPASMKALAQKGIDPAAALREVGWFVIYWQNATGNDARKRAAGWQLAFLKWCAKLAPKESGPESGAVGKVSTLGGREHDEDTRARQRALGASGRQADRIRRHFKP